MNSDLADLRITDAEIERLTGFEVNELFVGGLLGGVYRPSLFRQPNRLFMFAMTELIAIAILFVFTLPIGIFLFGNAAAGISNLPEMLKFLQITLGMTVVGTMAWNLYMQLSLKRFKPLLHLLDEVDRYHEILEAVHLLDQLETVQRSIQVSQRGEILEALRLTRDNLVSGLTTEKILRDHRGLFARRADLVATIETNLITLRSLEIGAQATEYAQFVNEALEIGINVQQEIQWASRSKLRR
ncbi:MAG TPA: hypothetical protein VL134_01065 [Leptolyngbya sp.]|jgi:hypothetical protein|nr:hypothetical protein [Leptolyngbya sp.]